VRLGTVEVELLDTDLNGVIDLAHRYGLNGMADIVETEAESGVENYELSDIDLDGVADYRDLDTDNDGLPDTIESDHEDTDFDGVIDGAQSLILRRTIAAVDQFGVGEGAGGLPRNTDADALADFRDPDSDNDGIPDVAESFGAQLDTDFDGEVDDFIDVNNNGLDDDLEGAPSAPFDTDGDGAIDAIETDADGDGIADLIESGGIDTDNNGIIDEYSDSDGDGLDDAIAAVPAATIDTDGDGLPDFQDFDSDNDGVSDIEEAGGTDADGDGLADALVSAANLIDTDGDGTPNFQQPLIDTPVVEQPPVEQPTVEQPTVDQPIAQQPVIDEPDTEPTIGAGNEQAPEEPAAATPGNVLTGLSGSGCSISSYPVSAASDQKTPVMNRQADPAFPVLTLLALLGLVVRKRVATVKRKAGRDC